MRNKLIKVVIVFLIILCSIFAIIFSLEIRKGGDFSFDYEKPAQNLAGAYIGGKKSKKYYFPWCYGAERTKLENREVLGSKSEAEGRGYVKAKNCSGL